MSLGSSLKINTKMFIGVLGVVASTAVFVGLILSWRMQAELEDFGHENLASFMDTMERSVAMQDQQVRAQLQTNMEYLTTALEGQGSFVLDDESGMETTVTNQATGAQEKLRLPGLALESDGMLQSFSPFSFVGRQKRVTGSECTIFVKVPGKLVRIATTVHTADGKPAIGTYIPAESPVYQAIEKGQEYVGVANVVGQPFLTHYRPIRDARGQFTIALFAGVPLLQPSFTEMFAGAKVGGAGYTFILDETGKRLAHPTRVGTNVNDDSYGKRLMETRNGFVEWEYNGSKVGYLFEYAPWKLRFGVAMTHDEMLRGADADVRMWAAGCAVVAVAIASFFVLLLVREVTRPMQRLSAYAAAVSAGDFAARMDYPADDAIGRTIGAVNGMVAEMKTKLGLTQGVLNGMTLPFAVCDTDAKVIHTNTALIDLLQRPGTPADWTGKPLDILVYGQTKEDMATARCLREGCALRNIEVDLTTSKGETVHTLVDVAPLSDLDGSLIGSFTIYADITALRQQQQRIEAQRDAMAEVATEADGIARDLNAAANELAAQVREASNGSDVQRARTTETATAMEQMNATVLEVAQSAGHAAENAENARKKADEGARLVGDVVEAIEAVREMALELQQSMQGLATEAEGIGHIMQVIEDIADQTNLLALNAAIEAARAGDAGRGFAVVADEVRKLAEKTMNATREVGQAIRNIQTGARNSMEATSNAVEAVVASNMLTTRSGEALSSIVKMVDDTADQVRGIATASEQQSAASEQISRATEEITAIAEVTAQTMNRSSDAVQQLTRLAGDLGGLIEQIRTGTSENA